MLIIFLKIFLGVNQVLKHFPGALDTGEMVFSGFRDTSEMLNTGVLDTGKSWVCQVRKNARCPGHQ